MILKDDGYVHIKYFKYPLPPSALEKNLTSEHNHTTFDRNYDVTLT